MERSVAGGISLWEHVSRRAFPSTFASFQGDLKANDGARSSFLTVAEITAQVHARRSDVVLCGKLVYTSKRGGALLLEDETGSIPIAIRAEARDPRLLNALVTFSSFNVVELVKWPESVFVMPDEWLGPEVRSEVNDENATKRIKLPEKRNPFYLEVTGPISIASIKQQRLLYRQEEFVKVCGAVSAISPVMMSNANAERYYVVELTNGKLIACFGKQNEGYRLLLRIGMTYSFAPLILSEIKFGSISVSAFVCSSDRDLMFTKLINADLNPDDYDYDEVSFRLNGDADESSSYQVNVVTYQGYVTSRPADFVVGLDHAYKALLNSVPRQMWLGIRKGALIRICWVCQLRMRDAVVGFEASLRTDIEIIEFSHELNQPQVRFPTVAPVEQCSGMKYYYALDFVARCIRCLPHGEAGEMEMLRIGLDEARKILPSTTNGVGLHPLIVFLYDWERPFCSNIISRLASLFDVVRSTVQECSPKSAFHVKRFDKGEQFLLCELTTNPITGQLCLVGGHDKDAAVECIMLENRASWSEALSRIIRIDEFSVIVERALPPGAETALPTNESISRCIRLEAPAQSKGTCVWSGFLSDQDELGFTRVYILIRAFSIWNLSGSTGQSLPSSISPVYAPGSITFSFSSSGECTFSSVLMVSEHERRQFQTCNFPRDFAVRQSVLSFVSNLAGEETLLQLLETRKPPKRLFLIVLDCQIVQARKYDTTFQKDRERKKKLCGVRSCSIFTDFALKLNVRDVQSPCRTDVFLNIEDRVIPPGLLFPDKLEKHLLQPQIWVLTGATVAGSDHKLYLHADSRSSIAPVSLFTSVRLAQYPRDLTQLSIGSLQNLRYSKFSTGACVVLSVVQVFWARCTFVCLRSCPGTSCTCPLKGDDCVRLQVLVEADDGTDQCQMFAEGDLAYALMDIPKTKLKEYCGHAARRLKKIDYKLNAECEPTSPQGLFRHLLLNGASYVPRRAFVMRDRPLQERPTSDSGFTFTGNSVVFKDEDLDDDHNRFAYTRTWQDVRVKTALRARLTVNLLEIETHSRDEEEARRAILFS